MNKNLRNSGINFIGSIPWGTHISQLYSSKEDFWEVGVPYILSGLLNNELCIWIYSQNTSYEEVIGIISKNIRDIDIFLERGQLKIIPHTEWYTNDSSFNEVRVNRQWRELITYALDQGFDGLRAVADTYWLEKSYYRDFSQYENNINKLVSELPFIVVCLYDAGKVDIYEAAEIIKNHSYVITRHGDCLELIKNLELLIKDRQLEESEERNNKNNELLNLTLEYDKMKTEFFSNISHELKTPLNVILATIQLLKSQKGQVYQGLRENKYLKIMQQNCYRLLRLVNNLIDITKIDSNYYEIKLQNYNIVYLVEEITTSVADYAMGKGITIIFDTNTEEKVVACDPDQIERIILNLLSNAIKFTPSGGNIWVTIFDKGEKMEISIKDTGIGIPQDKQECIFNRFQQVDKSLTRQSEGSGIGLSLVKALVEKHNGKINLNSELGKGSEFTIEIPCNILTEPDSRLSINQAPGSRDYVERICIEFSDIYS